MPPSSDNVLDGSEDEKEPTSEVALQQITSKKPTIEQFLKEFDEKVKQVNLTYKLSKNQFH